MKTKVCSLLVAVASFAGVEQAAAQLPIISSFSQNGLLVCSNLAPNSLAIVEWASSVAGPWQGLVAVPATSNGTIIASVPMFYRVRGLVPSTNAAPSGMALIPAGAFTMGDTLDGMSDAVPISVTVSAFYMDTNLVSKAE